MYTSQWSMDSRSVDCSHTSSVISPDPFPRRAPSRAAKALVPSCTHDTSFGWTGAEALGQPRSPGRLSFTTSQQRLVVESLVPSCYTLGWYWGMGGHGP